MLCPAFKIEIVAITASSFTCAQPGVAARLPVRTKHLLLPGPQADDAAVSTILILTLVRLRTGNNTWTFLSPRWHRNRRRFRLVS